MEKTNEELFKQALIEGFNNRIQREIDACKDEIVCSRRHKRIMKSIIKGKITTTGWNIPKKKVIAILVAAALLLVSCAIIYHDEIRDIITEVRDYFVEINFSDNQNPSKYIEEIYELTYIPEGYELDKEVVTRISVQYKYKHPNGAYLYFAQNILDNSSFEIDNEHGSEMIINIESCQIYYRKTNQTHCYVWNNGKYALSLDSSEKLSDETLSLIIKNIIIK